MSLKEKVDADMEYKNIKAGGSYAFSRRGRSWKSLLSAVIRVEVIDVGPFFLAKIPRTPGASRIHTLADGRTVTSTGARLWTREEPTGDQTSRGVVIIRLSDGSPSTPDIVPVDAIKAEWTEFLLIRAAAEEQTARRRAIIIAENLRSKRLREQAREIGAECGAVRLASDGRSVSVHLDGDLADRLLAHAVATGYRIQPSADDTPAAPCV